MGFCPVLYTVSHIEKQSKHQPLECLQGTIIINSVACSLDYQKAITLATQRHNQVHLILDHNDMSREQRFVLFLLNMQKKLCSDMYSKIPTHCPHIQLRFLKNAPRPCVKRYKSDLFFTKWIKCCWIFKDIMRRYIVLACLLTAGYATPITSPTDPVGGMYNNLLFYNATKRLLKYKF